MSTKALTFEPYLNKAMNYTTYMALMNDLLKEGKTTGPNQAAGLVEYTKLNFHRMERINKTTVLSEALMTALSNLKRRWTWLVITEAWCGDAAQNIPIMHAISVASKGKIDVKLVLRDENLPLMDLYLTNGGRAIPILICLETDTLKEIGTWGPRPKHAQDMVMEYKKEPTIPYNDFKTLLYSWYSQNKTQAVQDEFANLIPKWGSK
jgi:hypothetical protein